MTFSAPFLHHLGCHSPETPSPLPQVHLINPLPTHPVMTGCQASCAVREDLGACGLLKTLRAPSTSCTQRQQCCCQGQSHFSHAALQKWVSVRDMKLAELNHTHRSCWSVHCASPVGFGTHTELQKKGKGTAR